MEEALSFWLDNRNCAGTMVAVIGEQVLVLYRGRYYVVTGGAAGTRAGKALRYSASSLPSIWKKALKEEAPPTVNSMVGADLSPEPVIIKRERKISEKHVMKEPEKTTVPEIHQIPPTLPSKEKRKVGIKLPGQPIVTANCPYCNTRHEISLDKGKNGKPFFMPCVRCTKEFAVRFVPVTIYQAQVAGFQ